MYEILPHTADFKVKFAGKDFPALIKSVFNFYFDNIIKKECDLKEFNEKIFFEDEKFEFLIVRLLNELIFYRETNRVVKDYKIIKISETTIEIEIKIIKCKIVEFKEELKNATYHDLKLKKKGSIYELNVVIDV